MDSKNKQISIEEIEKRNNRIISFFKAKQINIKLVGNVNSPAIIYNNDICLSCYVHNFNLILTDKPFNSKKLLTIKLSHIISTDNDKEFINWVENAEHRAVYVIYFLFGNKNKIYLTGFNKNSENKKYLVFAEQEPKIYFNLENAKTIVDKFSTENIKLLITNDVL